MYFDDRPLTEFKLEVQQSLRQLAVLAEKVQKLTEQIENHAGRLAGFKDTLDNMSDRSPLR